MRQASVDSMNVGHPSDRTAMATPGNTTCWMLIEGAVAGRHEDQNEFVRRYGAAIRAYLGARWRQSPMQHEMDDAVQEVLVECFRRGGILDRVEREQSGGFRAYLFGATRNVARRFEERAGRRREGASLSRVLDNATADEPTLSRVFDRAYARAVLREAFELLDDKARRGDDDGQRMRIELLRLRFRDGIPIREIARQRNIDDVKSLHRALDRAKKEFREALMEVAGRQFPNSTAAELHERCVEILSMVG